MTDTAIANRLTEMQPGERGFFACGDVERVPGPDSVTAWFRVNDHGILDLAATFNVATNGNAIVVADTTRCRHYDVCDIRDADQDGCAGCYEMWPEPADEPALPF